MKLAEEVDAMRTIGVSPMEALVLPRVFATVLMMPLLSFYAAIVAIIGGGIFVWVSLDIPPITFIQRTRERSEEHTSELQSRQYLVCRLLLEKKHEVTGAERTMATTR